MRAFGPRALHIPAGNGGLVSAVTILRSVITRSDAIIKAPSNDPLTAMAIARTLADIAPDHPITRHLAVAYWKGGDTAVEEQLYRPDTSRRSSPGAVSPRSTCHPLHPAGPGDDRAGPEAQRHDHRQAGLRRRRDDARGGPRAAAVDVGVANQEGCANARVIYVMTGTDDVGIANANKFGEMVYEEPHTCPHSSAHRRLRPATNSTSTSKHHV